LICFGPCGPIAFSAPPRTGPLGRALAVRVDIYALRQANYRIRHSCRFLGIVKGRAADGRCSAGVFKHNLAMTAQRLSYTFDSTLETVDTAEQAASQIAAEAGFDEDVVMQIGMAVREAAINAVLHGNAYDPGKKVTMDFERTGQDLVITIRDQGQGLDISKIPDPLAPENLMKTSGRGIFLIRSFMDEVEINPSKTGTEVKLTKHVHGPTADAKEASP
jgi:serine/threonine-protein kinase RsbW